MKKLKYMGIIVAVPVIAIAGMYFYSRPKPPKLKSIIKRGDVY